MDKPFQIYPEINQSSKSKNKRFRERKSERMSSQVIEMFRETKEVRMIQALAINRVPQMLDRDVDLLVGQGREIQEVRK